MLKFSYMIISLFVLFDAGFPRRYLVPVHSITDYGMWCDAMFSDLAVLLVLLVR